MIYCLIYLEFQSIEGSNHCAEVFIWCVRCRADDEHWPLLLHHILVARLVIPSKHCSIFTIFLSHAYPLEHFMFVLDTEFLFELRCGFVVEHCRRLSDAKLVN